VPATRRRLLGAGVVALGAAWGVQHATARAVRRWRPPSGRYRRAGLLTVRTAGDGDTAIVLLHGLPASGDTFGAAFDALARQGQLVVPDLLGFGRSQDQERDVFSLDAHLDALDAMARELDLDASRLVVAGHSMGGLLAWHWAARRATQVDAVVTWCTPLFRSRGEARRRLEDKAPGLAWVAVPGAVSRTICTQLCTRRPRLTQWLYMLAYPRLPVPLARQLTQHTWASYAPAMTQIVLDDRRWRQSLHTLGQVDVPVVHASGARDVLAPPDVVSELGEDAQALSTVVHPTADHLLPLDHPDWCVELLTATVRDGAHLARDVQRRS
jgi:pimeloyl-ACP methyl ester carboxylesterase